MTSCFFERGPTVLESFREEVCHPFLIYKILPGRLAPLPLPGLRPSRLDDKDCCSRRWILRLFYDVLDPEPIFLGLIRSFVDGIDGTKKRTSCGRVVGDASTGKGHEENLVAQSRTVPDAIRKHRKKTLTPVSVVAAEEDDVEDPSLLV